MQKTTYLMCQFRLPISVVWYFGCLLFFCYDFLNSGCLLSLAAIIPIKSYSNAEADKAIILKENKNKSGIYMFKNSINGKRYIGSSDNLKRRFCEYFNTNYLLRNPSMGICCALLKHGSSNFSITILEYCEVADLLIRERYYWDLFNPEYNIAKDPTAPMSGRNHSEESKTKISDAMTGENHPNYGKTMPDETKKKISDTVKKIENPSCFKPGENHPNYGKPRFEGAGKPSQQIEVIDKNTNEITVYNSISEAGKALNISHATIVKYFTNNQQKPYKGRYTFKKI